MRERDGALSPADRCRSPRLPMRKIALFLALLFPCTALAAWPVDVTVSSSVDKGAFVTVDRPCPQPWIYLTASSDSAGGENTAEMSMTVAWQVSDAIDLAMADGGAYVVVVDADVYVGVYRPDATTVTIEVGNLDSTEIVPVPMTFAEAEAVQAAIETALQ